MRLKRVLALSYQKITTISNVKMVALGIMLSRVAGLIRERAIAHYFGNGWVSDALRAAQRIPNFLQNLFGEGVLSASFIPVYSKLLISDKKQATDLASSVFLLLSIITSSIVGLGVLFTPYLVDLITPGFEGEQRALTIKLVKLVFPSTGVLVLSAWCLGVLNSHGKFLLSYTAPIFWNLAIILGLLTFGKIGDENHSADVFKISLAVGCFLQFIVQLPTTIKLLGKITPKINFNHNLKRVINNFFPVLLGRGVVQISAYVDSIIASLLPIGALATISYAQIIYLLPISLFGMSISIAKLPELSASLGEKADVVKVIKKEIEQGIIRICYYVIPISLFAMFFSESVVSAFFQTGRFLASDSRQVGLVLACMSLGILSACFNRLLVTAFYSLEDAKTPLKVALIRVVMGIMLSLTLTVFIPTLFGITDKLGIFFLGVSVSIVNWLEFFILLYLVNNRLLKANSLNKLAISKTKLYKIILSSLVSLFITELLLSFISCSNPILQAFLVFTPATLFYLYFLF
jgi:putative peptidoglycan lipid II flippase